MKLFFMLLNYRYYFKRSATYSGFAQEITGMLYYFYRLLLIIAWLLTYNLDSSAQTIDYSNCPSCTATDIHFYSETQSRYQGILGTNPTAPSTYNLIGNKKFTGTGWVVTNPFFDENWYPIRTEKQLLTGEVYSFGVSNYGNESDWNIHILPDIGFEDFITDAIPYRLINWYDDIISSDWKLHPNGRILIEAEITPDENRYGNPWFSNKTGKSSLLGKRITVYGPFVREESHGNHPEIHPSEQIWWKQTDSSYIVLLLNDDSNRFDDRADSIIRKPDGTNTVRRGDFTARRVTTYAYQPWSPNKKQDAELWIAFDFDPSKGGIKLDLQTIDDHNIYKKTVYTDAAEGDRYSISYKGNVVLTVQESSSLDPFAGVRFSNVCFNAATGKLQGFVVVNTSVGNGDGSEGFVALRIDKQNVPLNPKPVIRTGTLTNQWKSYSDYDERIAFSDIITSDITGQGLVNGMIDFNGNGKTDFFAVNENDWVVMYDGIGPWQVINNSSIDVRTLRFGDIDGDGKTDVLRVGKDHKIVASYGGITAWTVVTDGYDGYNSILVGDFNGDKRTDALAIKFTSMPPQTKGYQLDLYVKYNCSGTWKKLKSDLYFDSDREFSDMVRFGDFNGDGITDIFRYSKNRFGVYWNGTGNYKEIYKPLVPVQMQDLFFVNSLELEKFTDIIHVDKSTRQWTIFFKGYEPFVLPPPQYNDPSKVKFGKLSQGALWEMISIDYIGKPTTPVDINQPVVPLVEYEPVVMSRYIDSSIKKQTNGAFNALSLSMSLQYYPGSKSLLRKKVTTNNIEWVKDQVTGQSLPFVINTSFNATTNLQQTIISIPDIPLRPLQESYLQIKFKEEGTSSNFVVPALGIKSEKGNVREMLSSAAGNWNAWVTYLTKEANAQRSILLDHLLAVPAMIKEVQFEVVPLYASLQNGKIMSEEIHEVAKELTEIAYSYDTARYKKIFTDKNAFTISWQLELKDLVTGNILPIPANMIITKGRWIKSKVIFPFPETQTLLQLKAIATIRDEFGNTNGQPQPYIFYNQRIDLPKYNEQSLIQWLKPFQNAPVDNGYIWVRDHWERMRANEYYFTYSQLLKRVQYLAEDNVLTPGELNEIIEKKFVQ